MRFMLLNPRGQQYLTTKAARLATELSDEREQQSRR
jgi:hypothetical protein